MSIETILRLLLLLDAILVSENHRGALIAAQKKISTLSAQRKLERGLSKVVFADVTVTTMSYTTRIVWSLSGRWVLMKRLVTEIVRDICRIVLWAGQGRGQQKLWWDFANSAFGFTVDSFWSVEWVVWLLWWEKRWTLLFGFSPCWWSACDNRRAECMHVTLLQEGLESFAFSMINWWDSWVLSQSVWKCMDADRWFWLTMPVSKSLGRSPTFGYCQGKMSTKLKYWSHWIHHCRTMNRSMSNLSHHLQALSHGFTMAEMP